MSTLVSVDWDFFIPHRMYDEEVYLPAVKDTMPGPLVFDWQMSEGRMPALEDVIWRTRAGNFKRWGLDIEQELSPFSVEDFMTELSIKLDGAYLPAWRADSHAHGALVARDFSKHLGGPLSVVNFDAHHDLGYTLTEVGETVSCENWALVGLAKGWISDYTVVYPDWLGKREWTGVKRPHLKPYKDQIHITTWSEWVTNAENLESPEVGFFCRSSSWTPPWLDESFQALCDEWGWVETMDHGNTNYNVDEIRPWDWAEVEADNERRNKIIADLHKELDKRAG